MKLSNNFIALAFLAYSLLLMACHNQPRASSKTDNTKSSLPPSADKINEKYFKYNISFSYPSSMQIVEESGDVGGGNISFVGKDKGYDRLYLTWISFMPMVIDDKIETGTDLYLYKWLDDWSAKQNATLINGNKEEFIIPNVSIQQSFVSPIRYSKIQGLDVCEKIVCTTYQSKCYLYFWGCFYCGTKEHGRIFIISFNSLIKLSSDQNKGEFTLKYSELYNTTLYTTFENVLKTFDKISGSKI